MDSFQTFLKQARENWHILTMFVSLSFFVTVAAADAKNNIADQGRRLTSVETLTSAQGLALARIEERTQLILDDVRVLRGASK